MSICRFAYLSFVLTGRDSIELIGYGVCILCSGAGSGLLRAVPSFASWFAISLPVIRICAMLCLVHRI